MTADEFARELALAESQIATGNAMAKAGKEAKDRIMNAMAMAMEPGEVADPGADVGHYYARVEDVALTPRKLNRAAVIRDGQQLWRFGLAPVPREPEDSFTYAPLSAWDKAGKELRKAGLNPDDYIDPAELGAGIRRVKKGE